MRTAFHLKSARILAFTAILVSVQSAGAACPPTIDDTLRIHLRHTNTDRVLFGITANSYQGLFGDRLISDLEALRGREQVFDVGTGGAYIARDFVNKPGGGVLTAIALEEPLVPTDFEARERWERHRAFIDRHPDRIRYRTGHPVEDIYPSLGTARIVIDLHGAAGYTRDLTRIMEIYGQLVEPGGHLYLTHPIRTTIRVGGRDVPFSQWLGAIQGFRLIETRTQFGGAYVLERTADPVSVPRLRGTSYDLAAPGLPTRTYEWTPTPSPRRTRARISTRTRAR